MYKMFLGRMASDILTIKDKIDKILPILGFKLPSLWFIFFLIYFCFLPSDHISLGRKSLWVLTRWNALYQLSPVHKLSLIPTSKYLRFHCQGRAHSIWGIGYGAALVCQIESKLFMMEKNSAQSRINFKNIFLHSPLCPL